MRFQALLIGQCDYASPNSTCTRCDYFSFICSAKLPSQRHNSKPNPSKPSEGLDDLLSLVISKSPKNPEAIIDPLDYPYFTFFLTALPQILPYTNLFPSTVGDIFSRSTNDAGLRHSILSFSSLMMDSNLSRPLNRFYMHYIITLRIIQNAIQTMQINENLALSVFLIQRIDVFRAEMEYSRKHIRGLYLILKEIQMSNSTQAVECDVITPNLWKISPLWMHVWRMLLKSDWTTSLFLVEAPVLTPIVEREDFDRKWLEMYVSVGDVSEWALAAFELDNLIHKACHVASQVRSGQQASDPPELEYEKLKEDIQAWRDRPIVRAGELSEQAAELDPPDLSSEALSTYQYFPGYPPLRIVNSFYVRLLNDWRALSIYISLIDNSSFGPAACPRRFDYAVDICRTLAVLWHDQNNIAGSELWVAFFAGVVLCKSSLSQREVEWISRKTTDVVVAFPAMKNALWAYRRLWDADGNVWDKMEKTRTHVGYSG
jgi:hypothetical protein